MQWAFYSGHDATVAGFLNRLGLNSVECIYESYLRGVTQDSQSDDCVVEYPPFASTLIFEVYKHANGSFAFKVRYNGRLRKIPFCGHRLECPVERFYEWFEGWRMEDVVAECGIVDKERKKARTYLHGLEADLRKRGRLQKELEHSRHQAKKLRKQLERYQDVEAELHETKLKLAKSKKEVEKLKNAMESGSYDTSEK